MTMEELYKELSSLYPNVNKTNVIGIENEWNGIYVIFGDSSVSIQCTPYHYCNLRKFEPVSVTTTDANAKSVLWRNTAIDAEILIIVEGRELEDKEPLSYVRFDKALEYVKNVYDYTTKKTEHLILEGKVVFLEGDPNIDMEKVL